MEKGITIVGLDAHKVAINVSVLFADQTRLWAGGERAAAVVRMVRRPVRQELGETVRFCAEAGPCGYACTGGYARRGPSARLWRHSQTAFPQIY